MRNSLRMLLAFSLAGPLSARVPDQRGAADRADRPRVGTAHAPQALATQGPAPEAASRSGRARPDPAEVHRRQALNLTESQAVKTVVRLKDLPAYGD